MGQEGEGGQGGQRGPGVLGGLGGQRGDATTEGLPRLQCEQCEYQTNTQNELVYHVETMHKQVRIQCDNCPNTFDSSETLVSHIVRTHTKHQRSKYKSIVKKYMREAAFTQLKETQLNHEKGSSSQHENLLKPQKYLLTNKLTSKQKGLLFNLKCQTVKGIRGNFSQMYFGDIQCRLCNSESDSQCHLMLCPVLKRYSSWDQNIKYSDIYGTLDDQVKVTNVLSSLLEIRELLLDEVD